MLILAGCRNELDNRYLNPDKATSTTLDKLFTGMLANDRVWPKYWEMSTFVNWHIGIYTQSVGFLNGPAVYQQNESYIQDRWSDFYRPSANGSGVMSLYRQMEALYKKLDATQRAKGEVYMHAARVLLYDQATQMVDLWGDIPFSEAGALEASATLVYPKFDDAAAIYDSALVTLKSEGDYFGAVSLSAEVQGTFAKQDILLGGSTDRWRRYANSLRLRLLMRLSMVQESRVQSEVTALLANPAAYPLLKEDGYNPSRADVLLAPLADYAYDLHDAFNDWTNYPAPYYMLENVLKPANDLRIPVLFDKYGTTGSSFVQNTAYSALPLTLSRADQQASLTSYAVLDSTTFLYNSKLPGVVITAAEVNFLKAEAYERWGGGDPATEYLNGIRHSIVFYYYLNNLNPTRTKLTPPTAAAISDFLTQSTALQYKGTRDEKLQLIATQKWVHFGVLQSVQSWAEQRRTSYPPLTFTPAASDYPLPPHRLTYPQSEKNFNPNYSQVASRDTRNANVFWDPF
jgi:hypothetical protein